MTPKVVVIWLEMSKTIIQIKFLCIFFQYVIFLLIFEGTNSLLIIFGTKFELSAIV